jgi:putative transcription antitermination factor YqgF
MTWHKKKRKGKKSERYVRKDITSAQYMGIDWGKHDVGIALADDTTKVPFAYTTLENAPHVVKRIGEIIQEKGVKTVVLGIPSPINREEVVYESERLGELLENNYGVNVFYQNEMFSTKLAQTHLIETGIHGIERFDDQEAARIILRDYLERETLDSNASEEKPKSVEA